MVAMATVVLVEGGAAKGMKFTYTSWAENVDARQMYSTLLNNRIKRELAHHKGLIDTPNSIKYTSK